MIKTTVEKIAKLLSHSIYMVKTLQNCFTETKGSMALWLKFSIRTLGPLLLVQMTTVIYCSCSKVNWPFGHLKISRTWTAEMEMDKLSRDYLIRDN